MQGLNNYESKATICYYKYNYIVGECGLFVLMHTAKSLARELTKF